MWTARDFEATRLDDWLADVFAEAIGAKEQIDEYRVIAKLELGDPKEGKERFALAQRWMDLAKEVKPDFRWFPYQRARFWLRESLNAQQLKGLERTEAEKKFSVLNIDVSEGAAAEQGRGSSREVIGVIGDRTSRLDIRSPEPYYFL